MALTALEAAEQDRNRLLNHIDRLEAACRAAYHALGAALDAPKLDRIQRRFIEGTKQQCADALGGAVFYNAQTGEHTADPFAGLGA